MIDLLIRAADVLDGSGAPPRRQDVAIDDGRIVGLGREAAGPAGLVLEAEGLVLAPGFIDMHSHGDFTLPSFPDATNSLAQGVTTEVVGNCGFSPAPLSTDPILAEDQRAAGHGLGPGLDWGWSSFGQFLDRLDAARPAVNCIPLVGHGMVRMAVIGSDDRPASPAEIDAMRRAASEAIGDGAWGLSTGLVYPPGSYASTDEIVAVGTALQPADSLYASHVRDETDGLAKSLDEAIEIGRRLGVRVQVSHLKAAGRANHGRAGGALAILDRARQQGLRVTQDVYPYRAGSTLLTQLVPPWAHAGGTAALVDRLGVADVRARIAAETRDGLPGWPNYALSSGGWDHVRIAAASDPGLAWLHGLTIAEAARRQGVDPLTLVLDTIVADRGATTMIVELMADSDVDEVLAHPSTAVGSDQLGVTAPDARVHPRCYGSFVRVLGRSAREQGQLSLAEAVRRMTGLPASILGLTDRGRIGAGAIADLVLFDPRTVRDTATYDDPTSPPVGVEAVIVGGRIAVRGGVAVAPRLGRVLRSTDRGRSPRRPPR